MLSRLIIILGVLILGAIGGAYFYFGGELSRPAGVKNEVHFEVKQSEGVWRIAQNLQQENIIASPLAFVIFATYTGQAKKMQVGLYQIGTSETIPEIANKIAAGKVWRRRVTIPEGWAWWQIGETLVTKKLLKSSTDFGALAAQSEGYLFPDTYDFSLEETPTSIIEKMKENFTKKTAGKQVTREVVILASIVEREAKRDDDRPKIAGVYLNRIKKGMKLEADPTVQYAKGSWQPITKDDYQNVDSPYNTYRVSGYPPGPICNPGLKSIEAALAPVASDYLYFFHLKDGTTIYSKTEDEHNQNKEKYSSEISRAR